MKARCILIMMIEEFERNDKGRVGEEEEKQYEMDSFEQSFNNTPRV